MKLLPEKIKSSDKMSPLCPKVANFWRKIFLSGNCFHFHQKQLTNMLPTSHQPLSVDHITSRYVQKRVLGPKCPNMFIQPQALQNWKFWIFHFHYKRLSNTYNKPSTTMWRSFYLKIWQKRVLAPKFPNMVFRPQPPPPKN